MFAHYIHAFLLIYFTYSVAYAMRKFGTFFFGPPGIMASRFKNLEETDGQTDGQTDGHNRFSTFLTNAVGNNATFKAH